MWGCNGRDGETWRLHCAATATSGMAIPGRSLMSMNALFLECDKGSLEGLHMQDYKSRIAMHSNQAASGWLDAVELLSSQH